MRSSAEEFAGEGADAHRPPNAAPVPCFRAEEGGCVGIPFPQPERLEEGEGGDGVQTLTAFSSVG